MRIRCLRTGVVREKEGVKGLRRYLSDEWRDDALPVNAFLVEHPAGLCLFDTGQTAAAAAGGHFPRWQPFFRLARFELEEEDVAASQLEALGIEPRDVRWVALSHLHTDHAGGLAPFRGADVVVSRVEWERATGLAGRVRGYLPQHWPRGVEPRLLDLSDGGFGPFTGSHDLAGDGALLLVATSGHTPGHISLLVHTTGGSILLGGDLAHDTDSLAEKAPDVARYCVEHGIVYVGAHDPHAQSSLELAGRQEAYRS